MTALAEERKLSATKLSDLETQLRTQFKSVQAKSAATETGLRDQLLKVQARLHEQDLKGISDKSAASVALSGRERALKTELIQLEAAKLSEERGRMLAETKMRAAERGQLSAQQKFQLLSKSFTETTKDSHARHLAQQGQQKQREAALQDALNKQHVEHLKQMGDKERATVARMQQVIASAKQHQQEQIQKSLANAAKTHNLAAAKLQQKLDQSEHRARQLGMRAKLVHEQMNALALSEAEMAQRHKAELTAVTQQLAASDARIVAGRKETELQRMEFERNRDKMGDAAYQRAVQMLEAKRVEQDAHIAENQRALKQNYEIMRREEANQARQAAEEHNRKQQELSNAMAQQKTEMDKQMALKEAEHKEQMQASKAAMALQQQVHDTSQNLRVAPEDTEELAKLQHIATDNIQFKAIAQQFEKDHREFLNAPPMRPMQMPVLVEEPEQEQMSTPPSPPTTQSFLVLLQRRLNSI